MNANPTSQGADPRTTQYAGAFNTGAKKNVIAGVAEADNGGQAFLTQPRPNNLTPAQKGTSETHYDESSAHPSIPMKSGPMQQI